MSQSNSALWDKIQDRVLAAEKEIRAIRCLVAQATTCTCPIGFGATPNPRCPKHGGQQSAA